MTTAWAVIAAATFCWLGMVLAISFLEAPLKFRAPGVTVPIGLGIGRLVFRALNIAELVLAATILVAILVDSPGTAATRALTVAMVAFAVQVVAVRPRLTRRSDAVLAGIDAPRSHSHHAYIALEVGKVVALLVGGVLVFAHSVP
ncbi:hypothetical protein [Nocardia rhizosphaerihabitans]|uniref:Transmembrane protein n=1 Tax=Nocardia rhizosphaerihabitans TaxID=1691570 RepID=A0ABQ2KXF8_9NOCA|nr:hypothetical protein [Nocardia rhizosphaerihabitans]GGN93511.1 hypothetical protein GCM10011610_55490 [Nocardia rhizosphaerihabitans]